MDKRALAYIDEALNHAIRESRTFDDMDELAVIHFIPDTICLSYWKTKGLLLAGSLSLPPERSSPV